MMDKAADRPTDMKLQAPLQSSLDTLLRGEKTNMVDLSSSGIARSAQFGQQTSPDGPLSSPEAWQESLM